MQKCGADTGDMEKTGKSVDYPTLFIRDPTPDLNLSRAILKGNIPLTQYHMWVAMKGGCSETYESEKTFEYTHETTQCNAARVAFISYYIPRIVRVSVKTP